MYRGYNQRQKQPEQALKLFERHEDMDLNQINDLLIAKFGSQNRLNVKTLKFHLNKLEQLSENDFSPAERFSLNDYRDYDYHDKIVLPFDLYNILVPITRFRCTSEHVKYDINTLLSHFNDVFDYISSKMDTPTRNYLYQIPVIRNYQDTRMLITDYFEELNQLNSLMVHMLPQNSTLQLPFIHNSIRSIRQQCYIANSAKKQLLDSFLDKPHRITNLLNNYRRLNNKPTSTFPGIRVLLKCLTADNVDDVLIYYFLYKSIVRGSEQDTVSRDELFMIDTVCFHLQSFPLEVISSDDKATLDHFNTIQAKAAKLFNKDDAVELYLYNHLLDMARLLLLGDKVRADRISAKAKKLYSSAIKGTPKYVAPNPDE